MPPVELHHRRGRVEVCGVVLLFPKNLDDRSLVFVGSFVVVHWEVSQHGRVRAVIRHDGRLPGLVFDHQVVRVASHLHVHVSAPTGRGGIDNFASAREQALEAGEIHRRGRGDVAHVRHVFVLREVAVLTVSTEQLFLLSERAVVAFEVGLVRRVLRVVVLADAKRLLGDQQLHVLVLDGFQHAQSGVLLEVQLLAMESRMHGEEVGEDGENGWHPRVEVRDRQLQQCQSERHVRSLTLVPLIFREPLFQKGHV